MIKARKHLAFIMFKGSFVKILTNISMIFSAHSNLPVYVFYSLLNLLSSLCFCREKLNSLKICGLPYQKAEFSLEHGFIKKFIEIFNHEKSFFTEKGEKHMLNRGDFS